MEVQITPKLKTPVTSPTQFETKKNSDSKNSFRLLINSQKWPNGSDSKINEKLSSKSSRKYLTTRKGTDHLKSEGKIVSIKEFNTDTSKHSRSQRLNLTNLNIKKRNDNFQAEGSENSQGFFMKKNLKSQDGNNLIQGLSMIQKKSVKIESKTANLNTNPLHLDKRNIMKSLENKTGLAINIFAKKNIPTLNKTPKSRSSKIIIPDQKKQDQISEKKTDSFYENNTPKNDDDSPESPLKRSINSGKLNLNFFKKSVTMKSSTLIEIQGSPRDIISETKYNNKKFLIDLIKNPYVKSLKKEGKFLEEVNYKTKKISPFKDHIKKSIEI